MMGDLVDDETREARRRDDARARSRERVEGTRRGNSSRERARAPVVIHPCVHASMRVSIHPSILYALETPSSTEPKCVTKINGHTESRTDTTRRAIDRTIEGRPRASLDDGRRARAVRNMAMMVVSSRATVGERLGRRVRVRGATTTTRAGRELSAKNDSGRSGREGARREGETLDDVLNERDDGVEACDGARFACAAVMACAVMMSDGNAALADETSSLDAEVQALHAKTLDVEDQYERALEMNSEAVKALDDDKDNVDFESWNWQKLVNGKTGAGAPAPESKTKTKRVRKTPATAPKPTLVRKAPAAPPKTTRTRKAPTNATLRAQQTREENAAKLSKIQEASAARTAEQEAKRAAEKQERDAAAQAVVDARRAEKQAQLEARKRQADEETAAARARYDAQRARIEALRAKTNEEKEAELEAFRSREAPSVKATNSPAARRAGKKNTSYAARRAGKKNTSYAAKKTKSYAAKKATKSYAAKKATKPKTAKPKTAKPKTAKPKTTKPKTTKPKTIKPKTTKKYSGSLDRNSFRNVRRQEFGAGTAPFVFVGLTAGMMYLLFQEEDD